MANNPLYNSSLANIYRSIGTQMGVSPAFQNASIAQGIPESSLNPTAKGDGGAAFGLHQWHPDRQQQLYALAKQMNLPPTDPRVQVTHWYNENKGNWGVNDPRAANDAAIGSERPAGWKPGDPTGVPSYNKRLGDTMALMRLQNGQQDPQDPNSFMANGENATPINEQPSGAQSISLGDQENTQPFSNIGSTLANLGASLAGLDPRGRQLGTAIALSNTANNLASQEQAREREGGWKYAGQTQNGQGLIFQNAKGETRVEPLGPQFAGQKEPEAIRTLRTLQSDPSLMETLKDKNSNNGQETSLTDEGVESAVEAKFAGRKDAYTGLTKKGKELAVNKEAEFKKKYDVHDEDIMANQGKWQGVFAADRQFGKKMADVTLSERSLNTAIGQGRELLKDPEVQQMMNNPAIINKFNQFTVEQLNKEGLGKLAQVKENFETISNDYTRINALGGSTTTVRATDIARSMLNTGMSTKAVNQLFDFMDQTGVRVKQSLSEAQEEMRTNASKHKNISDYSKAQQDAERRITERNDKELERVGLKQPSNQTNNTQPSPSHIEALKAHPEMREDFDKKFWQGAAAAILGQ